MKEFTLRIVMLCFMVTAWQNMCRAAVDAGAAEVIVSLKTPGNPAVDYTLRPVAASRTDGYREYAGIDGLPLEVRQKVERAGDVQHVTVVLKATSDVYFSYSCRLNTGAEHSSCEFLLPGFWYRKNLRSPDNVPSFKVSDSWTVREDRLSSPVSVIWDSAGGVFYAVARTDKHAVHALAPHLSGDVVLSGETSLGHLGFRNIGGKSALVYGFPYMETPHTYVKKLRLAPAVRSFQYLAANDSVTLTWDVYSKAAATYSDCVRTVWEMCYDLYSPATVEPSYTPDTMKSVMSNFFEESYVKAAPVNYYSGVGIDINTCKTADMAEVGFIGRNLLNAFNALEYGESHGRAGLVENARSVFDSYLAGGFMPNGLLREVINIRKGKTDPVFSIRRQSEGAYALLLYMYYSKARGQRPRQWEDAVRRLLDRIVELQKADGSFPRKFNEHLGVIDGTGGSTSSAILPLVLGHKYFKDKRYLSAAQNAMAYIEKEIISKSDYFSSTLDANCEDKEASISAAMGAYYLALVSKGRQADHYAALAREAAYFALSWFYTWDVPFARGQMLGDLGLKSRGWGNVSIENNHIDVFVFDFADLLRWLGDRYGESRFSGFADVITTSMSQLLPYEGHLCGVAKKGYYPEVVQHTNWDYGLNGKGFYTKIFAPGWTVASLWELYTPKRVEGLLCR